MKVGATITPRFGRGWFLKSIFLEKLKEERKIESDRKKAVLESLKQQMETDLKVKTLNVSLMIFYSDFW